MENAFIQLDALGIPERDILAFPAGLVGFPEWSSFTLVKTPETARMRLQCLDDKDIAFTVFDAEQLPRGLAVDFSDTDLEKIGLSGPKDMLVLVILTIGAKDTTANLKAPLIINTRNNKGVQIILSLIHI